MYISGQINKVSYEIFSNKNQNKIVTDANGTLAGAFLGTKLSALVHEIQKERGMTAGFLGSKGKKFADKLPDQLTNTDTKGEELNVLLETFDADAYDSVLKERLKQANRLLDKLSSTEWIHCDMLT